MNQHINLRMQISAILVIMVLLGCTPQVQPSGSITETFTAPELIPSSTPIHAQATITPIWTRTPVTLTRPAPTKTSTIESSNGDVIQKRCLTFAPDPPVNNELRGTLVLGAGVHNPDMLLPLEERQLSNLSDDRACYSISPDGNWLVCIQNEEGWIIDWLVFESADGLTTTRIQRQPGTLPSAWLGSDLYSLSIPESAEGIPPVVVIDPLNGKQQLLRSDYPGLDPYDGPAGIQFHFNGRSVAYDPSLRLAVYPKTEGDFWEIVLWDRETEKVLASLPEKSYLFDDPLWSQDGEFVFTTVAKQATDTGELEDLFQISRSGEVAQLTHFSDIKRRIDIELAAVAPDGNRLVFWATEDSAYNPDPLWRMVMLDRHTLEMVDYCVTNVIGWDRRVAFSPDGRFVATTLDFSPQDPTERVIVIDTLEESAFIAAESASLIGWWNTP